MVAVVTAEMPDAKDPWRTHIALLVEDAWQGRGIGRRAPGTSRRHCA